ncbi:hypothetical protein CLIM01_14768 [Colletotrichum limetticola]|uniref:Secreted protein n=1 Tax=Colletotrichum limetticola TaxID=1209924 RepID=A0ABQ9PBV0_9PEZI|nr:hypothetical protein CLIM01_14768 [Colletotrichum limetticola]
MVHISSILVSFLAGAAVASPPRDVLGRQVSGDNATLAVTGIRYTGEGCPVGSLSGNLDPSGSFDVLYEALNTTIKAGDHKVKVKCQIEVDIQTAADRQLVILRLTIRSGTYKGHVRLTEGAWAKNQNQYKFKGSRGTINLEWPFKAPIDAATEFTNNLSTEFQSGCNSNGGKFTMIINNYLSMSSDGPGEGEISITELDGVVKQSTKLATAKCP